jgi:hypothetical protein
VGDVRDDDRVEPRELLDDRGEPYDRDVELLAEEEVKRLRSPDRRESSTFLSFALSLFDFASREYCSLK